MAANELAALFGSFDSGSFDSGSSSSSSSDEDSEENTPLALPKDISQNSEYFSKNELSFVEAPLSVLEIECPICLQVMLNDPHLTSCGHHFCGSCISRVKDNEGACPMCTEKGFKTFSDKDRLRIIRGLQVYCTNKDSGCEWSGELKDLADHINKGKRDGKCQYEEVNCRYGCFQKNERRTLDKHEEYNCLYRPHTCEYCGYQGMYHEVTDTHYLLDCIKYPVPCTNKCVEGDVFQRDTLQSHLDQECPLQPVECQFKWAGCNVTPLRKDLQEHNNNQANKHLSLLAGACCVIKNENDDLKRDNANLKKESTDLKKDFEAFKKLNKEREGKNAEIMKRLATAVKNSQKEESAPYNICTPFPRRSTGQST